jgi:hypothetical protein
MGLRRVLKFKRPYFSAGRSGSSGFHRFHCINREPARERTARVGISRPL